MVTRSRISSGQTYPETSENCVPLFCRCICLFTSNMNPSLGTASIASTQIKAASSLLRVPFAALPYHEEHKLKVY